MTIKWFHWLEINIQIEINLDVAESLCVLLGPNGPDQLHLGSSPTLMGPGALLKLNSRASDPIWAMLKKYSFLDVSTARESPDLDLHLQTDLDLTACMVFFNCIPWQSLTLVLPHYYGLAQWSLDLSLIVIYRLTFQLEPELASSSWYHFTIWAIAWTWLQSLGLSHLPCLGIWGTGLWLVRSLLSVWSSLAP